MHTGRLSRSRPQQGRERLPRPMRCEILRGQHEGLGKDAGRGRHETGWRRRRRRHVRNVKFINRICRHMMTIGEAKNALFVLLQEGFAFGIIKASGRRLRMDSVALHGEPGSVSSIVDMCVKLYDISTGNSGQTRTGRRSDGKAGPGFAGICICWRKEYQLL